MRTFDNGCFFSVTCDRFDVEEFNASWPCSNLPNAAITFQFDKRNGDLVDIHSDGEVDGPEAVALSQDAQAYGAKRLNLNL